MPTINSKLCLDILGNGILSPRFVCCLFFLHPANIERAQKGVYYSENKFICLLRYFIQFLHFNEYFKPFLQTYFKRTFSIIYSKGYYKCDNSALFILKLNYFRTRSFLPKHTL